MIQLTFLGTGTSTGVPMVGCDCAVCRSPHARDKRLRSSVIVQYENTCILVDTTPDLRAQLLRAQQDRFDAILITHYHKDHLSGLDDLRPLVFKHGCAIDLYANEDVLSVVRREYVYGYFYEDETPEGRQQGLALCLHEIHAGSTFKVGTLEIEALAAMHARLPILGFLFNRRVAYLTDVKTLNEQTIQKLRGIDLLVINALRHREHPAHLTVKEACELAKKVQAKQTYFTHISHELGLHAVEDKKLPVCVHLAYDNLVLRA